MSYSVWGGGATVASAVVQRLVIIIILLLTIFGREQRCSVTSFLSPLGKRDGEEKDSQSFPRESPRLGEESPLGSPWRPPLHLSFLQ